MPPSRKIAPIIDSYIFPSKFLTTFLAQMDGLEFPIAIGVLYCNPSDTYEGAVHNQIMDEKKVHPSPSINDLLRSGPTWTVD